MRIRKRIEEPFGWIKTIGGGLVQDHRRCLQPHPHHRPRRHTSLTTQPGASSRTRRRAPRPNTTAADPPDQPAPGPPTANHESDQTPNLRTLLAVDDLHVSDEAAGEAIDVVHSRLTEQRSVTIADHLMDRDVNASV